MKCENCGSNHSVMPFSLTVLNVGVIYMTLCVACRLQLGNVALQMQRPAA